MNEVLKNYHFVIHFLHSPSKSGTVSLKFSLPEITVTERLTILDILRETVRNQERGGKSLFTDASLDGITSAGRQDVKNKHIN